MALDFSSLFDLVNAQQPNTVKTKTCESLTDRDWRTRYRIDIYPCNH